MSNTAQPLELFNPKEPIPGYHVQERVGTGGYGEVWRAEAPGGLSKAIKFVYGHLDDSRATRELKSLNRIKEVQHPFLLSLERIEIVDGHLIIVTELAEASLKDRFEACKAEGNRGIPREELLEYLRDAADALDYLYEKHGLQHLDVKPENMLLVGGRVKVADFGLIKDLQDSSASLMGGLTPLYAPPEVFDGKPNRYSDQYSLAIVFQELLTGEPPFGGRSAAQLASQHLHSRPILAQLPTSDQPKIEKALSKNPQERYGSCREFIKALTFDDHYRSESAATPGAPVQVPTQSSESRSKYQQGRQVPTEVLSSNADTDRSHAAVKTQVLSDSSHLIRQTQLSESAPAAESLPPIALEATPFDLRPTVFIGIGGSASRTLRKLRRRLHDRFGSNQAAPVFQMLLLDTDVQEINLATEGESAEKLDEHESLAIPLRKPKDYRENSEKFLKWLSRRWIYNIPRSQQTEGVRPLGRLAFVDHAKKVVEAIRSAVNRAIDPESLSATRERTGIEANNRSARVFIVSSISGGTGSGMVLDVAYAVRKVFADLGITDGEVLGLLTHSTDRRASSRDLAVANAYATLTELQHYSRPGNSYAGEASCGLHPGFANLTTFDETYLVHLGDELNEDQFDTSIDTLAEYLYLDAATPANQFFDKCRHADLSDNPSHSGELCMRTLGLSQWGGSNSGIPAAVSELICKSLVYQWRGGENLSDESRPVKISDPAALLAHNEAGAEFDTRIKEAAVAFAGTLQLDLSDLLAAGSQIMQAELGSDCETYFRKVIEELITKSEQRYPDATTAQIYADVLPTVESIFGDSDKDDQQHSVAFEPLQSVVNAGLLGPASQAGESLRQWILGLVDDPQARVTGAQQAGEWFSEHLQYLERRAGEAALEAREEASALRESLLDLRGVEPSSRKSRTAKKAKELDPRILRYSRVRYEEVGLRGVCKAIRHIRGQVNASSDKLRDFWKDLNQVADEFDVSYLNLQENHTATPEEAGLDLILNTLLGQREQLVGQLDQQLEAEFFGEEGKLLQLLTDGTNVRPILSKALRDSARTVVLQALRDINAAGSSQEAGQDTSTSLSHCLELATPALLACGGEKRLLLVLPEGIDKAQIQAQVLRETDEESTALTVGDADMVACYEAQNISASQVAAHLIGHRSDYAKIASRLHTRVDVDWEQS